MDWLKQFFNVDLNSTIKTVTDSVDRFVTTDEDKARWELAKQQFALEVQKQSMVAEQAYLTDKQNARALYSQNNSIQKIYAMVFLVGYLLLTFVMLWFVYSWATDSHLVGGDGKAILFPDWAIALISSIFGAFSTKVSTITDFFFGSSQGSRAKDDAVSEAMKRIPQVNP